MTFLQTNPLHSKTQHVNVKLDNCFFKVLKLEIYYSPQIISCLCQELEVCPYKNTYVYMCSPICTNFVILCAFYYVKYPRKEQIEYPSMLLEHGRTSIFLYLLLFTSFTYFTYSGTHQLIVILSLFYPFHSSSVRH